MPWQKEVQHEHELTIMTYNTRAMMIGESLAAKHAMLRHINRLDADIVCLQ
jgi:endonuclease/exonuclease/phosphatase family metal-dependent hydrolase